MTRSGCGELVDRVRFAFAASEQQSGDATIAKFPDRSIQDEVMQVHQRHEDHEALDKIVTKEAAREPGTRHEKRDSADYQYRVIAPGAERRDRGTFPTCVVSRHPEILRAMHECQGAGTEVARGKLKSAEMSEQRRGGEPAQLRDRKRCGSDE
jgi:hypothetical protein